MNRILRIVGIIVLVIVVLFMIAAIGIVVRSNQILNQTFEVDVIALEIPEATDDVLAEGRRIYVTRGCGDCHGADGGGKVLVDSPALGTIAPPNITRSSAGVGDDFGAEGYMRAIMHGVAADGRGLIIMPSEEFTQWREEELGPLLAYLLTLEPVDEAQPDLKFGPIGRILIASNQITPAAANINHDVVGLVGIELAASIEYGDYLAHFTCIGCHAATFGGGSLPGTDIIASNITPHDDGIGGWSLEDFIAAVREGQRPDGSSLSTDMPWQAFSELTDIEVEALYRYLQTVEPLPGN